MMTKFYDMESKNDCCACCACMNICPKGAISMQKDEYGFLYPKIDQNICIDCGLCEKVCSYRNGIENNMPISVYAAITKSTDIMQSASGGIFAALANNTVENNGVVYGATIEKQKDVFKISHIRVKNKKDLIKIMGSKYVQSYIGTTYEEAKKDLIDGETVLFSGTPCQIAGLRGYLGKEYDKLYTVDVICHGVPNEMFFNDYLKTVERKIGGEIVDFKFRDKKVGWGLTAKATYTHNGKEKYKWITHGESSYYSAFLNSDIYRENCYTCKYANMHRTGDITIGDYWGIDKMHPEYLLENGGFIDLKKGSSCVIINTLKGEMLFNNCSNEIMYKKSDYNKVSKENSQLVHPSQKSENRDLIMNEYRINGYDSVEKLFYKKNFYRILISKLKFLVKKIIHI